MFRCMWFILFLLWGTASSAIPITGSFTGTTINSMNVEGVAMLGNFDGLPLSGSFSFETTNMGSAFVTIFVPDKPIEVSSRLSVTFLRDELFDTISLDDPTADVGSPPTAFARFRAPAGTLPLIGGSGSAFAGLDASGFDSMAFDLQQITLGFAQRRGPIAFVALERLSFDGPGTPVPAPDTLALLVLGISLCSIPALTRSRCHANPSASLCLAVERPAWESRAWTTKIAPCRGSQSPNISSRNSFHPAWNQFAARIPSRAVARSRRLHRHGACRPSHAVASVSEPGPNDSLNSGATSTAARVPHDC